jgi:hypothetical protein
MIFAMVNFNTANAEVNALMFYNETDEKAQWEYVEAQFITNVARSKQLCWRHIETVVPVILGSVAAYQTAAYSDMLPTCLKTNVLTADEAKSAGFWGVLSPKVHSPLIAAGAGAILTYNYAQCYIAHQANKAAIQDFFANYENNQYLVPTALQDAFDTIAERIELEGMQAVLADANDYIDIINDIVMRHFESRYKSVLDAKGRDALAESKTIIENFKNIFDGASKIK